MRPNADMACVDQVLRRALLCQVQFECADARINNGLQFWSTTEILREDLGTGIAKPRDAAPPMPVTPPVMTTTLSFRSETMCTRLA